jgi:hypothetical protein
MLKKLKKMFFLLIVVAFSLLLTSGPMKDTKTIPEKITSSTVFVNNSSGTVIYSDAKESLILTAYHVIEDDIKECSGCDIDVYVSYMRTISVKVSDVRVVSYMAEEKYKVKDLDFNESLDLALLRIEPKKLLDYSKVATSYPRLGDDIWTSSNPRGAYRSLKKGIVSAIDYRYSGGSKVWEISGGVVFGSSGGASFTSDGELFGVILSVKMLHRVCTYLSDEPNPSNMGFGCIYVPLTYIGHVSTPENVRWFITNSFYKDRFEYLQ